MPKSMFRPSDVMDNAHFNDHTKVLTVTFQSGSVYEYENVPERVFNRLNAAPSKGQFFNQNIRNKYAFKCVFKPAKTTTAPQVQPVAVTV